MLLNIILFSYAQWQCTTTFKLYIITMVTFNAPYNHRIKLVILKLRGCCMSFLNIMLASLGVSMDAFSVSLSNGICNKKKCIKYPLKVALYFSVAQGTMPILGYVLGSFISHILIRYSNLISFFILIILGFKTLSQNNANPHKNNCLLLQSIATSIDAMAIGISVVATKTNILIVAFCMALVTFIVCFLGVLLGEKFGDVFSNKSEQIGGIILIILGVSMLFN